ncbi:MAG TPA: hypothetical protein VGA69_04975 [Nitriliruptorales bacterium]
MARVTLLSAMAFDQATYDETRGADPVMRVYGELPASAQPFGVHRVYKGPQGTYEEAFLLVDPDGLVIWERPYSLIELRGEMFEDRFLNFFTQADIKLTSADEHQLVFLIDGGEAARIPVFIDAPESMRSTGVIDEAMKKAFQKGALLWLSIPQKDGTTVHRGTWYVFDAGRIYVIFGGPGEQELPNLADCDQVEVHIKAKDVMATIATVTAGVEVVLNDSDEFARIATAALGERLNSLDGRGAVDRWRETCKMVKLSPDV